MVKCISGNTIKVDSAQLDQQSCPGLNWSCQAFAYPSCFPAAWDTQVWNQRIPGLTKVQVSSHWCGNGPRPTVWVVVRRKERDGAGLLIHWRWRKWGCRSWPPPGRPHASCASLPGASVADSGEDSWCSRQQGFGSPYLGEWAPSAPLGWLPVEPVSDEEHQFESNTSLTTRLSQLCHVTTTYTDFLVAYGRLRSVSSNHYNI